MGIRLSLVLLGAVSIPMLGEAWLSRRHERTLRVAGAVEPAGDPFRAMRVAYPSCFVAMLAEGLWGGSPAGGSLAVGMGLFLAAKALKYWAMWALGSRWSFRVLVLPGEPLVVAGPYRFVRHPNYVAVIGEIVGIGAAAAAPVTGGLAVLGFGWLIVRRVRVESAALRA